jgi:hypothetical protein
MMVRGVYLGRVGPSRTAIAGDVYALLYCEWMTVLFGGEEE